jgi:site-specific recombinase XerD
MSRTTFSIAFVCRESKKNKQGLAPVELSITLNGVRKFVNLPRKEKPSDFNRKHRSNDLEDYLSLMRSRVNGIMTEMLANGEPLTTEAIREYVKSGGYKSYTVGQLFNDYLKLLSKRVDVDLSMGVYRKYELVRNMFFGYVKPESECSAITPAIIKQVQVELYAKYDASTAAGYLTKLKTFIKFGLDNDKLKVNPFQGVKINKGKKPIEFLTQDEINVIANKDYGCDRLKRVADCFVFQCCSGLAYADLCLLKPDDLKQSGNGYYIQKRRQKTGTTYTAVVLPKGVEIWNRYQGELPVISNQRTNSFLHEIEVVCGIKKSLHTHLARKSYASGLLRMGVRIEVVSKTLGHANVKITQAAYADLLKDDIIKEVTEKI